MKKLLGILGTITIAGSGVAGLVGNAPAPAKNKINYLQTDNLEKLNRVKRNQYNFVNLIDLIKKGGYLLSRDVRGSNYGGYSNICGTKGQTNGGGIKSQNSYNCNIEYININNLTFSNTEILKPEGSTLNYYDSNNYNVGCAGNNVFKNFDNINQTFKTTSCDFKTIKRSTVQIQKGLTTKDSKVNTDTYSYNRGTNTKIGTKITAGFDALGIKFGTELNFEGNFNYQHTDTNTKSITLEESINIGNTDIISEEEWNTIQLPSQSILIGPRQAKKLNFVLQQKSGYIILDLKQKISGNVKIKLEGFNEDTYFIKNIMQKLQQDGALPSEIIINNDDSITFIGKVKVNFTNIVNSFVTLEEIPLL